MIARVTSSEANVRLVYLDEAGISNNGSENTLVIAGCVIDMDLHWHPLRKQFESLVEKFVPPEHRPGFVFHAKDIWHGAKAFDRRAYAGDRRAVLRSLCALIGELDVGIVYGFARKDELATTLTNLGEANDPKLIGAVAYMAAFVEALHQANTWMSRNAPRELCSVVVEDNDELRRLGKTVFAEMRSGTVPAAVRELLPGLPFEHVLDEPSYTRKAGAPVLQLADLCAFLLRRWLDGKTDADEFLEPIRPLIVASRFTIEELRAIVGSTGARRS